MREELERLVRMASRATGRHGLAHAYGHCSARLDDKSFLVSPAKPLGLVAAREACTLVAIDGPLPDGVLGEVRIHREIYRRRPDVGGVIRSMPPHAVSLAALGRAPSVRHGIGSYFWPQPSIWPSPQLVRSDEQAAALAETMGQGRAILMRGNGAVVAGASVQQAAVLTWYLEDMCRIELAALAIPVGGPTFTAQEAAERATWSGGIEERMWDYLAAGDEEIPKR